MHDPVSGTDYPVHLRILSLALSALAVTAVLFGVIEVALRAPL